MQFLRLHGKDGETTLVNIDTVNIVKEIRDEKGNLKQSVIYCNNASVTTDGTEGGLIDLILSHQEQEREEENNNRR